MLFCVRAVVWIFFLGVSSFLRAQATEAYPSERDIKTVLDPAPYISARAASMGGALSTLADQIHAPFYNPAGIGGLHWERQKPPFIRLLNFPYIGMAANQSSAQLIQEFDEKNASTDRAIGKAILSANAGKRQYGRVSSLMSFGAGRTVLVHSSDTQIAAYKKSGQTSDEGSIAAAYRSLSMTGVGASVTDPKEQIYLGAFVAYLSRGDFNGDISYQDIINKDERKNAITSKRVMYNGVASNLGLIWVLGKFARPTIGVSIKNVGGTSLQLSKKSSDSYADPPSHLKINEDLTLGFSLSPRIGKQGALNFIVEGTHLNEHEVAVNKKFRTGLELNLGGFGSEALVGARVGYNLAGLSYGLSFNFKLIQFEYASSAEDIGIDNRHVVETRQVAVFSVNVTDD